MRYVRFLTAMIMLRISFSLTAFSFSGLSDEIDMENLRDTFRKRLIKRTTDLRKSWTDV